MIESRVPFDENILASVRCVLVGGLFRPGWSTVVRHILAELGTLSATCDSRLDP